MRLFVTLSILLPTLLVSLAQASGVSAGSQADDIAQQEQKCLSQAESNLDMNNCVSDARSDADALLSRFYNQEIAKLKAAKDSDSKEILKRLVSAERAWIDFRDAECSLQGIQMLGGTGEGLTIGGCLMDKTIERVKSLDNLFQSL